jgi:hypothetical protein
MPTSEDYKRSAEECRKLASHATEAIERETLLRMADQWQRFVEHKAKKEASREGKISS